MFDTMTMTKTVGAVCGSLLVLMLVGWAGNSLYTVGGGEHGEHAADAGASDPSHVQGVDAFFLQYAHRPDVGVPLGAATLEREVLVELG